MTQVAPLRVSLNRLRRFLRRGSNILLVLGLCALIYSGMVWAGAHIYQAYQSWRFDHWARQGRLNPGLLLARLEVPRVNLSVMVLEGDDPGTLRVAVGHLPGTALPGQTGNVVLAGHRDTFFRVLRNVRKGDTITLTTASLSYSYRVESTRVVGPRQAEVLAASPQPTLTLVTCYPFYFVGSAPNRFVVRARLVASRRRESPRA